MKNEFIPALNGQFFHYSKNLWNDYIDYKQILISSYPYMKYQKIENEININGFKIYGDSGGYSNIKKNLNLNVKNVLKWQHHNTDVIFSLDYPPTKKDPINIRYKKYEKGLENIEYMINNKIKNKEYYACIHGLNMKELKFHYENIKIDEINGFGICELTNHETNIIQKIDRLVLSFYLAQNKKIHLLGLSSSIPIAIAFLLSNRCKTSFTFDNSSYSILGCRYRQYINNINTTPGYNNLILNKNCNITELDCDCPICKKYKIDEFCQKGSIAGILISLHNLYIEIKRYENLKRIIKNEDEIFKFLKLDNKSKKIKERVSFVFKCDDLEKYINKFYYV